MVKEVAPKKAARTPAKKKAAPKKVAKKAVAKKAIKNVAPKKSGKKHLPKKPVAPSFIEEAVVITPVLVEVTEIVQVSNDGDSGSFGGEQTSLFSED